MFTAANNNLEIKLKRTTVNKLLICVAPRGDQLGCKYRDISLHQEVHNLSKRIHDKYEDVYMLDITKVISGIISNIDKSLFWKISLTRGNVIIFEREVLMCHVFALF